MSTRDVVSSSDDAGSDAEVYRVFLVLWEEILRRVQAGKSVVVLYRYIRTAVIDLKILTAALVRGRL